MLAIVTPQDLGALEEVCMRWEVRARVVGTVTAPEASDVPAQGAGTFTDPATTGEVGKEGRLRIVDSSTGDVLADVPAASLSEDAPVYDRPMARPDRMDELAAQDPAALEAPADCGADVLAMLADTSWVYSQYDHQLFLNTVAGPGGDATVLRLAGPGIPPSERALAISTDSNPRWCALDPRLGTTLTVAESALNVACAGARPVALVNCLNFGNPEHPEVMWQLSESIDGMSEACVALRIPVIGGNVSLYNESAGSDIDPTPVVATLGVIESLERPPPGAGLAEEASLLLLGEASSALGGSRWAVELRSHLGGRLPGIDLGLHGALLALVAQLVRAGGLVDAVHDVSAGGLGVALAECVLSSGVGCEVAGVNGHGELFSESPGRVVVCSKRPDEVRARAEEIGVQAAVIGETGGARLVVEGLVDLSVGQVAEAWRDALPSALGESA